MGKLPGKNRQGVLPKEQNRAAQWLAKTSTLVPGGETSKFPRSGVCHVMTARDFPSSIPEL